ncbi:MAG TPA: tetratricopeptide repeat protein [Gemmataceae bacterium]|nr:tetratricopeptide repeat protein [Gemmataceae bacterium]
MDFFERKEFARAVEAFTRAIELSRYSPHLLYKMRAAAYGADGKLDRAIADYEQVIYLEPDASNYSFRACLRCLNKDYDEAIKDCTTALKMDPRGDDTQRASAYGCRGYAHSCKGDLEAAIEDYTEAIKLVPASVETRICRASVYAKKGEYDEAIADYTRALEEDRFTLNQPNSLSIHVRRADLYQRKGKYKQAIADVTEALRLQPDSVPILFTLGWVLSTCELTEGRNGKQAVEYATKACQATNWKSGPCLECLAAALAETGQFKDAVKWQEAALKLPDFPKESLEKARQRLKLYQQGRPFTDK